MPKLSCSLSQCNNVFYRRPSRIKENNFCSRSCLHKYNRNRVEIICDYCRDSFKRPKSKVKTKTGLNFCCRKHKDKAQRNSSKKKFDKLRPDHYSGKETIYTVRKYIDIIGKCENCGYDKIKNILEIHHIDRDRENNNRNNIKVLCPNCHQENHYKNKDGRYSKGE